MRIVAHFCLIIKIIAISLPSSGSSDKYYDGAESTFVNRQDGIRGCNGNAQPHASLLETCCDTPNTSNFTILVMKKALFRFALNLILEASSL